MKNLIGILILLSLTSTAYADEYVVRTKIYDGENLIGSPAMQISSEKEAGAAVSGSYDLKLFIKPVSKNTASVITQLTIGSEHLSPSILVEFDKESTTTVNGKSISILVSKVST